MNDTLSDNSKLSKRKTQGGKYLTFSLGHEVYAFEILSVVEIIGFMEITVIPQIPKFILGVINLRNNVIPIMDLRARFQMASKEPDDETVFIILQTNNGSMGVMVDKVLDVVNISEVNIENTPDFGTKINTDFILGLGKINSKVIILLSIKEVLTKEIKELVTSTEQFQLNEAFVTEQAV